MEQCQRIVCYRLGLSPEGYLEHMYQCMQRYLLLRPGFADWPEAREAVASHPLFASWWKNQWLNRELQWVNAIQRGDTKAQLADSYAWLHNPRVLAGGIHPNSERMEHSFGVLIGTLQKQGGAA